ncbi:MAG: hypothetical protein IJ958_05575 [Agathobacter sp.]|nr:hypothetical protein [Agathobacter sp.]
MSQAKVDQYKKEKANRRETIAKEKRNKKIMKLCGGVIVAALAVWVGFSAVEVVKENRPVETIYVDTAELDNYISELFVEE